MLKLDPVCEDAQFELARVRVQILIDMGFTPSLSDQAVRTYGTVQQALEALLAGKGWYDCIVFIWSWFRALHFCSHVVFFICSLLDRKTIFATFFTLILSFRLYSYIYVTSRYG